MVLFQIVTNDFAQLTKEIGKIHPHAVIISRGSDIPAHRRFADLMTLYPSIRFLTPLDDANFICVNQHQVVEIEQATDMIDLILNKNRAYKSEVYLEGGCS